MFLAFVGAVAYESETDVEDWLLELFEHTADFDSRDKESSGDGNQRPLKRQRAVMFDAPGDRTEEQSEASSGDTEVVLSPTHQTSTSTTTNTSANSARDPEDYTTAGPSTSRPVLPPPLEGQPYLHTFNMIAGQKGASVTWKLDSTGPGHELLWLAVCIGESI